MFDYIIVGSGSAGGVLANRLSADRNSEVLLIEAGGSGRGLRHALPAGVTRLVGNPKFDWIYHAEADPSLGGRVVQWSGGKALGGSSSINGMVYVRGSRSDYDDWAAQGCTGWGFDDVLPYFRKMETFRGNASPFHGTSGPLRVEPPREMHPVAHAFIRAAGELGVPIRDDYCDGDQFGAFECLATLDRGTRSSVRRAYIDAAAKRPNLRVLTRTIAQSLIMEGRRAVGVRVRREDDSIEEHRTRGEVLVCCGAIQSPLLLMRSGMGPGSDLQRLGIPVVSDLPDVGGNLQEHGGSGSARRLNVPTYNVQVGPAQLAAHLLRYVFFRRGALASAAAQALAYFKTDSSLAEPDYSLTLVPLLMDWNAKPPRLLDIPGAAIGAVICKPRARGRIRLRDTLPESKPIIEHRMLEDEDDLRRLLIATRMAEKMWETKALAPLVAGRLSPPKRFDADEEWLADLKQNLGIGYHPVGTCRMGQDPAAVVDPALQVNGIDGLRVVDASIMPRIVSGNTNAATIMIGERASDMILADKVRGVLQR